MNFRVLFNQAFLAEASYADFWDEELGQVITDSEKVESALTTDSSKLSLSQAKEFTKHWQVVSHQPDLNSGFSATLFKNRHSDVPKGDATL